MMHFTDTEIRTILSPLYSHGCLDASVDMADLTALLETMRLHLQSRPVLEAWDTAVIDIRYDKPAYYPLLRQVSNGINLLCLKKARQAIEAADTPAEKWVAWLKGFAYGLVYWNPLFSHLAIEKCGLTGEFKKQQKKWARFSYWITDGNWFETYDGFMELAANEEIDKPVRARLMTSAGLVHLYWLPRPEAAMQTFEAARALNPGCLYTLRSMGEYMMKFNNFGEAQNCFKEAMSRDAGDTEAFILMGDSYRNQEQFDIAKLWYDDALRLNFTRSNIHGRMMELLGYEYYREQATDDAFQQWIDKSRMMETGTPYENIWYSRLRDAGLACRQLGLKDRELAWFEKAVALRPDLAAPHTELAFTLANLDRMEEAEASYKKAANIKTGLNFDAWWSLGWLYDKWGKYDNSIRLFKKCLRLRKSWHDRTCNELGNVCFHKKAFAESVAWYWKAVGLEPSEKAYWDNLLSAAGQLPGDTEKAKVLRRAAEFWTADAEWQNKYAIMFYGIGDYEKSVLFYTKAVHLKPEEPVYLENRARAWEKLGNTDKAIEDYKKGHELRPDAETANTIGVHLYLLGQYPEAKNYYLQAIRLNDQNPLFYSNLGHLLQQENDYEGALQQFEKAFQLEPAAARFLNYIGLCHYYLKSYDEAVKWYDKAIAADAGDFVYANNKALALEASGQITEALKVYDDLWSASMHYEALAGKAALLSRQGRYTEALLAIEQEALKNPDHVVLGRQYGQLLYDTSQWDLAYHWYRTMASHPLPELDYYHNRAGVAAYRGQMPDRLQLACKEYEVAIQINPSNPLYFENMGVALGDLGLPDQAEHHLFKAVEMAPADAELYNTLGLFYARQYDYAKALDAFNKAKMLSPEFSAYAENVSWAELQLSYLKDDDWSQEPLSPV